MSSLRIERTRSELILFVHHTLYTGASDRLLLYGFIMLIWLVCYLLFWSGDGVWQWHSKSETQLFSLSWYCECSSGACLSVDDQIRYFNTPMPLNHHPGYVLGNSIWTFVSDQAVVNLHFNACAMCVVFWTKLYEWLTGRVLIPNESSMCSELS